MSNIVISATFTAEPLEHSLIFLGHSINHPVQVQFAPYNQVFQQLLSSESEILQNQEGINIFLLRLEDWGQGAESANAIEKSVMDFVYMLESLQERSTIPRLICICEPSERVVADYVLHSLCMRMEKYIIDHLAPLSNTYVVESNEIREAYHLEQIHDIYADQAGQIPYTQQYFIALGAVIARKLDAIRRAPHKVIILDCDNTLWKGVCGEDGALGIEVGASFQALQEFMVAQYHSGMLLCLCSKNIESDVLEVFEQRPEMPLKIDHLVAWKINWSPKSQNIKELAQELQLGADSFIFIDDNPLECAEVRANCPEVLTLQLPADEANIPDFLKHLWIFDRISVATDVDAKRTLLYRQNVQRERLRNKVPSLQEFLEKLDLNIQISPIQPEHFSRVAQLTQRTNQFNLTTRRRTESELRAFCQDTNTGCLIANVSDRFGDYGLVGAVLYAQSSQAITVDTFLLSCRALGRGVEERLMSILGEIATSKGINFLEVLYYPTKKNKPALDFLTRIASQFKQDQLEDHLFHIPADYASQLTQRQGNALPAEHSADTESTMHPTTENDSSSSSSSMVTEITAQSLSKSEQYQRIATDLCKISFVQKILTATRHSRPVLAQPYVPPQTATEKAITEIWQDVLHIEQVGLNDNFTELGGGSLHLVQIYSQLKNSIAPDLAIVALFDLPTISALAQYLAHQNRQETVKMKVQSRATRQKQALERQKRRRIKVA
ncbi:HAD-IIIC family phosphatase [Chloroflexi bacterium TSY]|nr:HAD-IIIC family phosphatase [Chloroflexi bacterium TSY]